MCFLLRMLIKLIKVFIIWIPFIITYFVIPIAAKPIFVGIKLKVISVVKWGKIRFAKIKHAFDLLFLI